MYKSSGSRSCVRRSSRRRTVGLSSLSPQVFASDSARGLFEKDVLRSRNLPRCVVSASATNSRPSRAERPKNNTFYLTLPEEVQERFGLPEHPGFRQGDERDAGNRKEIEHLVRLLPVTVQKFLFEHEHLEELVEVVMDLGRTPLARFPDGDVEVSPEPISKGHLLHTVDQVGTFGADNRAGISSTLHRISCIRNRAGDIIGLTCRVGRAVPGSASMITDLVIQGCSILLLGRPGMGKTTAIREISRLLADSVGNRIVICDTSNEIGGDGDVPHPGIGRARRMQVTNPEIQHKVMIEAVENHMPQVIVVDEIGTEAETHAARTISQRGVQLIATAHGNELENLIKNPSLVDLVGGVSTVTLGDEEARRRGVQKSILERTGPPTFDVCIEMISRDEWAVHEDVGHAVDMLLAGKVPPRQVRSRQADGRIVISADRLERSFSEPSTSALGAHGPFSAARPPSPSGTAPSTSYNMPRASPRGSSLAMPRAVDPFEGWDEVGEPVPSPSYDPIADQAPDELPGGSAGKGIKVYLYGVDDVVLRQCAAALGMPAGVRVVDQVQDASLVLSTRPKMRSRAAHQLRSTAKETGLPIMSLKDGSQSQCVKALRTIFGIDPSPGNVFGQPEDPYSADPVRGTGSYDDAGIFVRQ